MANITIIIPFYNVSSYIDTCLQSVAGQSLQPTEVLLINDGTTDNSRDICESFVQKFPYFRIIDRDNGGVSAARNTGLDHATGDYVVFVDSDDILTENALANLYDAIKKHQADMVKCGIRFYYGPDRIVDYKSVKNGEVTLQNNVAQFQAMFEKLIPPYMCNGMYKRDLFKNIRFTEGMITEDVFIMPDLIMNCRTIAVIPDGLYLYRQRAESVMHTFDDRHFDIITSIRHVKQVLESHDLYDIFREEYHIWSGYQLMILVKHAAKYSSFFEFLSHRNRVFQNISKEEFEMILQVDPTRSHPQKSRVTEMSYANNTQKKIRSFEANALLFWLKVKYNEWRKRSLNRQV